MNTLADLLWLSMDGSAGGPPGNDDAKKIAEVVGVVQLWLGQDDMRRVIWSADIEAESRRLDLDSGSRMTIAELRASAIQRALIMGAGVKFGA